MHCMHICSHSKKCDMSLQAGGPEGRPADLARSTAEGVGGLERHVCPELNVSKVTSHIHDSQAVCFFISRTAATE